jgi:flavin-dependent dehydrogenase
LTVGELYDAIVVGASFAGLAAARELHGRVLLIDRKEIGAGQTSACGTLLRVVEALGLTEAVHQVQPAFYIHGARRTLRYDLGDHPLCTFDYRRLCEGLGRGSGARFVRATVLGVQDGAVVTDQGRFRARCLVDASGWRAVLASSLRPGYVTRERLSFGLETVTDGSGEALYFWFDPEVMIRGVTWIFPIGGRSRVGIASYRGESRLKAGLGSFLASLGRNGDGCHGGFFPWRLREPTAGPVFVVGDAAGQCLPVTGEGIRPSLHFGAVCGRIVQQVIEGELTLEDGLSYYRRAVHARRRVYRALEAVQAIILRVPPPWTEWAFRAAGVPAFFSRFWAVYAGPPARRATTPSGR